MKKKRMINKIKGHKDCSGGYTLIEVLVTVVIFAVLTAAINAVLLVGESSWQTNSVRTELVQEVRKAVAKMENDLRQTGPSALYDKLPTADGTEYESIKFQRAIGVQNGNIKWNQTSPLNPIYTEFKLDEGDSNQLQRIEGSVTEVVAQNIQTLEFSRQAATPDIIEVILETQKDTVKGRTIAVNFSFKVQMRN